jgi:hypothetical protein
MQNAAFLVVFALSLIDSIGIFFGVLLRKRKKCTWLVGIRFVDLKDGGLGLYA